MHGTNMKTWIRVEKMGGDYHGQRWTTYFLLKEGVKVSDIHRRLSAVGGQKAPACISIVLNWIRDFYRSQSKTKLDLGTRRVRYGSVTTKTLKV
jgi:hypothetical protein